MKNILIIKMSALGDVMIAMPHIEAIVEHHKDDQVSIITGQQFVDFFSHHPRLNAVVLDRKNKLLGNSTLARIFWVRKHQFDSIYDLQGNRTSRLLVRFAKAAKKIGTQPKSIYTHAPTQPYTSSSKQNAFERLNETLNSGGIKSVSPGCELNLCEQDKKIVNDWKKASRITDRKYALLHAGSSGEWLSKRWPEKYFSSLAYMLEQQGIQCIWIGGPDDKDLNARLAQQGGIDATGLFTPLQLYWLGKNALFAVTNDSGPMHILCTSGIPVYSFFGPTDKDRSHGAGQADRVFSANVSCSPCFGKICKSPSGHICMERIEPGHVFERLVQGQLFKR